MKGTHGGQVAGVHNRLLVIDCEACGFRHLDPLPSDEDMARMYESGRYYTQEKPAYISTSVRDREWWRASYDRFLDIVRQRDRQTLLDIGCGPGMLLEAAQARGWRCTGIEPSPVAAEHARSLGLNVRCCSFADFPTEKQFDVVTATGVLEHVRDPGAVVAMMDRVLAPDGEIMVAVPRDFSPLQRAVRFSMEQIATGPYWWIHHTHINYFSRASLEGLLKRHGFRIVDETTDYPMEWFLLQGLNYIGNDELGAECHRRRKAFDLSLGDEAGAFYGGLAEMGMGRGIFVAAKREDE